jgi:hypothetical protein
MFFCIKDEVIPVGKIKGLRKRRGVSVSFDFQTYEAWTKELKDTNPLMSSLLVIFVWGGVAIL